MVQLTKDFALKRDMHEIALVKPEVAQSLFWLSDINRYLVGKL